MSLARHPHLTSPSEMLANNVSSRPTLFSFFLSLFPYISPRVLHNRQSSTIMLEIRSHIISSVSSPLYFYPAHTFFFKHWRFIHYASGEKLSGIFRAYCLADEWVRAIIMRSVCIMNILAELLWVTKVLKVTSAEFLVFFYYWRESLWGGYTF